MIILSENDNFISMEGLPPFAPNLVKWLNWYGPDGDDVPGIGRVANSEKLVSALKKLLPRELYSGSEKSIVYIYTIVTFCIKQHGHMDNFSNPLANNEKKNVFFALLHMFILSMIINPNQNPGDVSWWPQLEKIFSNWLSKNPKTSSEEFKMDGPLEALSDELESLKKQEDQLNDKYEELEKEREEEKAHMSDKYSAIYNEQTQTLARAESTSHFISTEIEKATLINSELKTRLERLKNDQKNIQKLLQDNLNLKAQIDQYEIISKEHNDIKVELAGMRLYWLEETSRQNKDEIDKLKADIAAEEECASKLKPDDSLDEEIARLQAELEEARKEAERTEPGPIIAQWRENLMREITATTEEINEIKGDIELGKVYIEKQEQCN